MSQNGGIINDHEYSSIATDIIVDHNGLTNGPHPSKSVPVNGIKACNGLTVGGHEFNAPLNGHKVQLDLSRGSSAAITSDQRSRVYVLSAFEKASIILQMRNMHKYLTDRAEDNLSNLMDDMAFTLAERRSLHAWRLSITASSQPELIKALIDEDTKPSRSSTPPKLAFVFTGQGAQWAAMGKELIRDYPVFASTIQDADICLKGLGAKWSLLGTIDSLPSLLFKY